MAPEKLRKISAVALFVLTIATLAVMWQPAFWATALAEVGAFALACVWLILYMTGAIELQLGIILIPLAAAALWPLLQLALGATIYRWSTSVSALYWAANAAVVFVGLQIFGHSDIRKWYLRALVAAGFVLAVVASLQAYTSDGKIFWLFVVRYSDVAMGPFVYRNQYAAFIELLLPIALTHAFSDRTDWRIFHQLAAAAMYASVLVSASRMGFVLTSLELVVVPLLVARRTLVSPRLLLTSGAIFLGMLVVLSVAAGPETLIAKLQQKDPYLGRREYAESSLRMIRDKPLLGVGMGNWSTAYPAYATFDNGYFANQAHNDWTQWAAEGGLPFAFLILSVAIWSVPRALRTGWGAGVIFVFLHCLVDYPIQRIGVALVFFSLIAAIASPEESREPAAPRRSAARRAE